MTGSRYSSGSLGQRLALPFAACAAILLASAAPVHACACIKDVRFEPCGSFWTAEAVFEATVLGITPVDGHMSSEFGPLHKAENVVRLAVHRSWKGVVASETAEVITNAHSESCGFDFEVGRRYVVFADQRGSGGRLEVSQCGPTRALDEAADALAFLATLSHPALGGVVFGTAESQPAFDAWYVENSPLPGEVSIRVVSDRTTLSTVTDGGRYRISGLPPGRYQLSAEAPPGYVALLAADDAFEIRDHRACAMVDLIVEPAGRLNGRLVDALGLAIAGGFVELEPVDTADLVGYGGVDTDADGTFEIRGLPAGAYRIRASLKDVPLPVAPDTIVIRDRPLTLDLAALVKPQPKS